MDGPYKTSWCDFLQFLMRGRGLTATECARKIGISKQMLHYYMSGKVKPPIADLEYWAEQLSLGSADRQRFLWLALEAFTPAQVWERVQEADRLAAANAQKLSELQAQLHEVRRELIRASGSLIAPVDH